MRMIGDSLSVGVILVLITGQAAPVFAEDMMSYMNSNGPQSYMFTGSYLPQDTKGWPSGRPGIAAEEAGTEEGAAQAAEEAEPKEYKEPFADYIFRKVHPYMNSEMRYDSNIYLTQTSKKDDFVNTSSAGTKLIFGKPGKDSTMVQFDGGMESDYYFYSGFNRQHPFAAVDAIAGVGDYKFTFSERYREGFTPTSNLSTNIEGFTDFSANSISASADAKLNRIGLNITYRRDTCDFEDPFKQSNTIDDNGVNFIGFYKPPFFKKSNLLAEYEYGKVAYTKAANSDNNYYYNLIWVGVVGNITKKISGVAKAGYEYIDYPHPDHKDHTTFPAIKVELKYKHSSRTELALRLSRLGTRSSNFAYGTSNGNYASISLTHYFGRKLSAEISGYILDQEYLDPKYFNTGYGGYARLTYHYAKWIRMYLEYRRDYLETRGSQNGGYIDNMYTLRTDITF